MKKSIRRILALVLVTGIFLTGALPASASTTSWTTIDGTTYHLYLTINRQYNQEGQLVKLYEEFFVPGSAVLSHVQGQQEHGYCPANTYLESTADYSTMTHNTHVRYAAQLEGLKHTATFSTNGAVLVPIMPNSPTGDYELYVRFFGLSGSWQVTTGIGTAGVGGAEPCAELPGLPPVESGGTLYFAPNGETNYAYIPVN